MSAHELEDWENTIVQDLPFGIQRRDLRTRSLWSRKLAFNFILFLEFCALKSSQTMGPQVGLEVEPKTRSWSMEFDKKKKELYIEMMYLIKNRDPMSITQKLGFL